LYAVVYSGSGVSSRRLAEEGEEVHAATLFFTVLAAAAETASTALSVEPITDSRGATYPPWIGVRYTGAEPGLPAVRALVEPIEITNGLINIVGDVGYFVRGDSNRDGAVNITDPVATLNYLFLGNESPRCMDAADANDDGSVEVSDPIATLQFLFGGAQMLPPPRTAGPDPTPDLLGCLSRT
jgi:hypothetical protein